MKSSIKVRIGLLKAQLKQLISQERYEECPRVQQAINNLEALLKKQEEDALVKKV